MEDLIEYLELIGNGDLDMVVRKWEIDVPLQDCQETWKLIIQKNIIASIIRDSKEYKMYKETKKDNFIYKNNELCIILNICRDPSGAFAEVTGYLRDSNTTYFTYQFYC